ncbi:zinc finger protein OZF-like isoform X1 [Synchiropus splendidus]|uniref:zinc finger protein OZF-like isoform X1 n=1 Tax=Synchiropus splendidus TaxID=270530 RepID=UPI00237DC7AD|nr:zinc finger protein OZF-like isoform X1 [Synchiropus splendidus]
MDTASSSLAVKQEGSVSTSPGRAGVIAVDTKLEEEEEDPLFPLEDNKSRTDATCMDVKEEPLFSVEETQSREPAGEGGYVLDPSEPSDVEEAETPSEDEGGTVKQDPGDPDYAPDSDCDLRARSSKDEESSSSDERVSAVTRFLKTQKDKEDCASLTQEGATDERVKDEAKPLQPQRRRRTKPCTCQVCGKVFNDNNHLHRHLLVHTGEKPFKCFICARGFSQRGNLKTHMKVHKGETNWTLLEEKSNPKPAPVLANICGACGMDFLEQEQLEKHREIHQKPFSCSDCGKAFKSLKYLELHPCFHPGDAPFCCRTCGRRYLLEKSLKDHELRHTGKKSFHCDQCGKSFWRSYQLRTHLQSHSDQRPHLCAVCGKSYARAATLKVHLRVHTGETPYLCSTCGKSFYYSQGYREHLLVHNKRPKVQVKPLGRPKRNLSGDG